MRVKLVYESNERPEVIEVKIIPRLGEQLMIREDELLEITAVVHTPENSLHAAVLTVAPVG